MTWINSCFSTFHRDPLGFHPPLASPRSRCSSPLLVSLCMSHLLYQSAVAMAPGNCLLLTTTSPLFLFLCAPISSETLCSRKNTKKTRPPSSVALEPGAEL